MVLKRLSLLFNIYYFLNEGHNPKINIGMALQILKILIWYSKIKGLYIFKKFILLKTICNPVSIWPVNSSQVLNNTICYFNIIYLKSYISLLKDTP